MGEPRLALIVANSTFEDPVLRKLTSPPLDADELAGVLRDERFGNFRVEQVLLDCPRSQVEEAIEGFFMGEDARVGDLRLLYFSGHGIKDDDGRLYLPATNTNHKRLRSTAIDSRFISDLMQASPCRRQVLILDACYSGAFGRAMLGKGDDSAGVKERFQSRGRCVLAASDAMQQAFEGEEVSGEAQASVFTRVLVDGIKDGTADIDHDGWITFNELSAYVEERLRGLKPPQIPMKFALEEQGELLIARAPNAIERKFGPPPERSTTRLAGLRATLDEAIPEKRTGTEKNFLLCTWNIRTMQSLTTKWESTSGDSPRRDLTDLYCIAEIVRRFDVTVISEVKSADNMSALRFLTSALGESWSFTVTGPSKTPRGNEERRAFIFDVWRARPSGLASEIAAELPDLETVLDRCVRRSAVCNDARVERGGLYVRDHPPSPELTTFSADRRACLLPVPEEMGSTAAEIGKRPADTRRLQPRSERRSDDRQRRGVGTLAHRRLARCAAYHLR
jgi:hypothetical protein